MPLTDALTKHLKTKDLIPAAASIDGKWLERSDSGKTFEVHNPSTGELLAVLPDMGAPEAKRAIAAADAAQAAWAAKTGKARAAILRKMYELMMQHQDDLAAIMTAEQGKPLAEARGEIAYGASYVEWFGEEAKRVYGDTIPGHQEDKRIIVLKRPPGLFSLILGTDAAAIGQEFCSNPSVKKLSFTGSTNVGKILMRQAADQIQRLSLELGGNAPFIVFDDADLDAAGEGALISKYRNNGQTCVCANRLYVQAGVYAAFAEKLVAATRKLQVGDGFTAGTQQGPLINDKAVQKIERHIADATEKGAT